MSRRIKKMMIYSTVLALTISAEAQDASLPPVSAVRTKTHRYFGTVLEQSKKEFTLFDIVANELVTLSPQDITSVKDNYPQRAIQSSMGLPAYTAWRIASVANIGTVRGRVALADRSGYFVSLGSSQGVEEGTTLTLKGEGKSVTDPKTGKLLKTLRPDLAKLKVLEVPGKELCRVGLSEVSAPVRIKRGMIVEWRRTGQLVAVLPLRKQGNKPTGNQTSALQQELIDALVARGVSVVSQAKLTSAKLKLSKGLGVTQAEVPSLALATDVSADFAVTGTILPKTTSRAVARLRVIDTSTGNYLLSVDGAIRVSKPSSETGAPAPPGKSVMKDEPGPMTDFVGISFVKIPPGTFMMGSPENFPHRKQDETLHRVTLTQPFEMGIYEVTQSQYQTVMGTNPSEFEGVNNPVEKITWFEAVDFCKRITNHPRSKAAGYVYRLPTEAEWEYACRSGTTTLYSFGDDASALGKHAWYSNNSNKKSHPVGQRQPNAWGLYDMHGNVWEWCMDWYGIYPNSRVTNPTGPSSGSIRVFRGGGFPNDTESCRAANRNWINPSHRDYSLGFSVVRTRIK